MRGGPPRQGYTIIEVMIFLAVSGVMFLIAAAFISGKQDQVQFRQSMNDINSQVQQVINNVINGYYPSGTSFTCSVSGTGSLSITPNSSGGNTQGTNGGINATTGQGGCVYLGQVIQFGAGSSGQNPSDYGIFTVAGSQYGVNSSSGSVSTDPPDCFVAIPYPSSCSTGADPTAVYPINPVSVNLTQTNVFQGGMTVTGMYDTSNPSNALRGVGFFSNFGQASNNSPVTQSLQVVVYSDSVSDISNNNQGSMANEINNAASYASGYVEANPEIIVCFDSGISRYGTLTIGDNNGTGSRLTTSIQISSAPIGSCPS
jgi:type II secretory pathway pseudopilin PulG